MALCQRALTRQCTAVDRISKFPGTHSNRERIRLWQTILLLTQWIGASEANALTSLLLPQILEDHLTTTRQLLQFVLARLALRFPSVLDQILEPFQDYNSRSSLISTLAKVLMQVAASSGLQGREQERLCDRLSNTLRPWLCSTLKHAAILSFYHLQLARRPDPIPDHERIATDTKFMELLSANSDAQTLLQSDHAGFFLQALRCDRDFNVQVRAACHWKRHQRLVDSSFSSTPLHCLAQWLMSRSYLTPI